MELNTTGIDKFLVYLHAKGHFVPYESGTRIAMHPTQNIRTNKVQQSFDLQVWWIATSAHIKADVNHIHIQKK